MTLRFILCFTPQLSYINALLFSLRKKKKKKKKASETLIAMFVFYRHKILWLLSDICVGEGPIWGSTEAGGQLPKSLCSCGFSAHSQVPRDNDSKTELLCLQIVSLVFYVSELISTYK